jgi:DNA-binding LacI/PurR family transcriptional regulator
MKIHQRSRSQGIPIVNLRDIEWKKLNPNITLIKVDYQKILKRIVSHLEENGFRRYFYFSSSRNPGFADEKTLKFLEATKGKTQTVFYQISDPQRGFDQVINIKDEILVDVRSFVPMMQ